MKVFYRPKSGDAKLKHLLIDSKEEPARRICHQIQFMESIAENLRITLFNNKTGQMFKEGDMVPENSFLEYTTAPIASDEAYLTLPTPQGDGASALGMATGRTPGGTATRAPPQQATAMPSNVTNIESFMVEEKR